MKKVVAIKSSFYVKQALLKQFFRSVHTAAASVALTLIIIMLQLHKIQSSQLTGVNIVCNYKN